MVNSGSSRNSCEAETECSTSPKSAVKDRTALALDSAVRIHLLRDSDTCEMIAKCGWWI